VHGNKPFFIKLLSLPGSVTAVKASIKAIIPLVATTRLKKSPEKAG
jgi:hypothetical protein